MFPIKQIDNLLIIQNNKIVIVISIYAMPCIFM